MKIEEFALERYQSLYENRVACNLSESGVEPLSLQELLTPAELQALVQRSLGYPQTNGLDELRAVVASMYPGASADNVLITSGSAESNFIAMWSLLEPGDEVVLMLPNYMQIWGIARAQGARIREWKLRESHAWSPDLDELDSLVNARTKIIALCNPNNPTGSVLREAELERIAAVADRVGAVLYADEVYRGAERNGVITPTCHGLAKQTIVVGGLSKAYGLPGLRIGWLVGSADFIANAWHHHDYTTIAAAMPSQLAALGALREENRKRLLDRTRKLINANVPLIEAFVARHGEQFNLVPPQAGAMAFMRYKARINSTEMAELARKRHDILIVAGDCYGMDGYLRIGIGGTHEHLVEGLGRLSRLVAEIA